MSARRILILWLAVLAAPASAPAQVPQKSPDELLQALNSPDWRIRSDAAARLEYLPADRRPASYHFAMIALLDREATNPPDQDARGKGEGYGEYVVHLVRAVVELEDPRALQGVVLLGTGTSRRTNEFIAAHGDAALPYLEEASRRGRRHEVIILYGRMIGDFSDSLSTQNRSVVLRSILDARGFDKLAFVVAASDGKLALLTPLVERIAADTSPRNSVRSWAARVAPDLRANGAALTPAARVRQLSDLVGALCLRATDARADACRALSAMLAGPEAPAQKLERFRNQLKSDSNTAVWSREEREILTQ
jgi:hypothetical protein